VEWCSRAPVSFGTIYKGPNSVDYGDIGGERISLAKVQRAPGAAGRSTEFRKVWQSLWRCPLETWKYSERERVCEGETLALV
jgi:hypothetical protein